MADQQEDSEVTDVSLITGALRGHNLLISEPSESTCGSSVVLRNQTMTVANTANSAGMWAGVCHVGGGVLNYQFI